MTERPNILIIQVDEMAQQALAVHGNKVAKTPNLDALAARSVVFDNAYCNYPVCSPSRASMHAGKLPFSIAQWDNGAEFFAEIPTFAHFLRHAGYSTTLCGKMHFIGPDQYHGYEERLTTDVYPSDFSWTSNWGERIRKGGGIRVRNVTDAGPAIRNMQEDFDEEVAFAGVRRIYDMARNPTREPFLLTVSFTQPHPPFVAPQKYWDMYSDDEIEMPHVPAIPYDQLDAFAQARYHAMGHHLYDLTDERVRRSRRAYYAMMTYVDDLIGNVLDALEKTGMAKDTVVVFTSDHGEMLGERGMWMKECFYEWSAKVPLFISAPGVAAGRRSEVVSLVDLMPTLLEFAGMPDRRPTGQDGDSLVPLMRGEAAGWKDEAICEYAGSGHPAPSRMVRRGRYKYWVSQGLPPVLHDLEADPDELTNIAGTPEVAAIEAELHRRLMADWDPEATRQRILESQARRLFLRDLTEKTPKYSNWSPVIVQDDANRYVRGRQAAFFRKAAQRFPMFESPPIDFVPDDPDLKP